MPGDTPKACPSCGMEPSAGRHANFTYCEHPCHATPAPDPFDAAIAALDVEPTHHTDRMVTTYDILGLDAVRAAHRAEVERAVAEERALCERLLERRISDCDYLAGNAERGGNTLVRNEWEAKAAELRSALCAIRARGGRIRERTDQLLSDQL